jgi:hypothetical protein
MEDLGRRLILRLAILAGGCAPQTVVLNDVSDSGTADSPPAQDAVADATAPSVEVGCMPKYITAYYWPQPTEMMIVLDRSSSMQQPFSGTTRATAVQNALLPAVNDYQSKVEFGLEQFPGWQCQTGTCCSRHVLDPTLGSSGIGDAIKCVDTRGIGCSMPSADSPSHMALAAIQQYFKAKWSGDAVRYVLLVTASDPSCSGQDPGNACDIARQATSDLINDHTTVIVVNVGGSQPDKTSCLSHVGQVVGSPPYSPVSTLELTTVFNQVISNAASSACTLTTYQPPPGDVEPTVSIGNKSVPHDSLQGWSYANTARTSITLAGNSCDEFLNASARDNLSLVYSCSPCASGPTACPSFPSPYP